MGTFEAEQGRIGHLLGRGVGPGRFAKLLLGAGGIQDVVGNLEEQAQAAGVVGDGGEVVFGRRCKDSSGAGRGDDEASGLVGVDEAERVGIRGLFLGLDVGRLAADEAERAYSFSQFGDDAEHSLRPGYVGPELCDKLEGADEKSVAGKQRGVLIELLMA